MHPVAKYRVHTGADTGRKKHMNILYIPPTLVRKQSLWLAAAKVRCIRVVRNKHTIVQYMLYILRPNPTSWVFFYFIYKVLHTH